MKNGRKIINTTEPRTLFDTVTEKYENYIVGLIYYSILIDRTCKGFDLD